MKQLARNPLRDVAEHPHKKKSMADEDQREVEDAGQYGFSEAETSSTCFSIYTSLLYSTVSCSTTPLLIYPQCNNVI